MISVQVYMVFSAVVFNVINEVLELNFWLKKIATFMIA